MSIVVLPTHLVNKIAAGEVIERPASIVKELVENSLDAGASRIEITVEDGGRKLISVTDDGCGIGPEDLALAFAPHATSKIHSDDDLFAISTMGFRGEALASIAAISHANIRSRTPDGDCGYEVAASGESRRAGIDAARPCAAPVGTTVTVRDLFFNTPARRKFMRTANTEFGHISEQLARLALPHPQVAFRLVHNAREAQNLPAVASTAQRVADLFGPEAAAALLPIRTRGGAVGVSGLVGRPAAARASGGWQYFFLNGRFIRDRLLSHALREAYRGIIDPQRWPVAFVFIAVDPAEVDVNVHPTKIEVRFRDSQAVHGSLLAALRETLNQASLAPTAQMDASLAALSPTLEAETTEAGGADDTRRQSLRQALADFFKSAPSPQPRLGFAEPPAHAPRPEPVDAPGPSRRAERDALPIAAPAAPPPAPLRRGPAPMAGGAIQIHNSYIVAADDDGLIIVDQHALHERLVYNDLQRRITEAPLVSQRLLLPETLTLTDRQAAALLARDELLDRLGIEIEPFGPGTLAVQRFPTFLAERKVPAGAFIRELADVLADDENTDTERLIESVLEIIACKAAVKAGDPLSPAEMADLLVRRQEAEKGSSCPHGRPTTLRLTLRDLEKQFKRA